MRVLIASKFVCTGPRPVGGVQTWGRTVGDVLTRQGHSVVFWEPGFAQPGGSYDLGIFANLKYTAGLLGLCKRVVKVSHGVIPDEQGGEDFLAVSEEVAEHWGCKQGVIRQPIDLSFWAERPPGLEGDSLVRHSYRGGLPELARIAAQRGWGYEHLRNRTREEVRAALLRARVAVASGRAALEAMAMGIPVAIADNRRHGPMVSMTPIGQMTRNYSTRGGHAPTEPLLNRAIDEAIAQGSLREHVAERHDAEAIVGRLLEC